MTGLTRETDLFSRLSANLNYEPKTGEFFWKTKFCDKIKPGDKAGFFDAKGRRYIAFEGKNYLAHRLAWLLIHGDLPQNMIDHIDGNPSNNKLSNLRDASRNINSQNQKRAKSDNKSGYLGVSYHKSSGKFQAGIKFDGKYKYLGSFTLAKDAHDAYLIEKRKLHQGCTI